MSKPGITSKGGLSWKKVAGAGAVAAVVGTALALTQCDGDEQTPAPQPTETPDTTNAPPTETGGGWKQDAWVYRYTAPENMPIRESASADGKPLLYLKEGSCVEARPGADGYANRQNGFAEVSASPNGVDATEGWMELKKLSNHVSYKKYGKPPAETCTAEFITASTAPETKGGPVQFFSVSGSVTLYNTADETSAPAGVSGNGSCMKGTGIERGHMIQMQVNGDKTYWAVKENFRPAPYHITDATCQAKIELTP